MSQRILAEKHDVLNELIFRFKLLFLTGKRILVNVINRPKKFLRTIALENQKIIAESNSDLWNADDNELNWILTAGKVQNLRIAVKRINGLEIPAKHIFSFWRHIGNPNWGKGYVVGREIREGCIVPTIAGGLCQLSNALYDAAVKTNFEIIERHKHTQVIRGSFAEQDRDATVKWNYIDLRFKSAHAFRIEAELTQGQLVVRFRSAGIDSIKQSTEIDAKKASLLNDCFSCGNYTCFKHPGKTVKRQHGKITTYILDDRWPEYDDYIKANAADHDYYIIPTFRHRFIRTNRYNWSVKNPDKVLKLNFAYIRVIFLNRLYRKSNVFALQSRLSGILARTAAKKIPLDSTHLVISQNLLPYLWEQGALGGRTYDVLMTRLPAEKLHERLNEALARYPSSPTLNDFRASSNFLNAESAALTQSERIITPHLEIAEMFNNKSVKIKWAMPDTRLQERMINSRVLFPASSLARKGAYEVRQLAKELKLTVLITGKAIEYGDFWDGVETEFVSPDSFENINLLIYPAYVEHQPRILLKAIGAGLPVITTTACGLEPSENLTIVPIGNYHELKKAVLAQMSTSANEPQGKEIVNL